MFLPHGCLSCCLPHFTTSRRPNYLSRSPLPCRTLRMPVPNRLHSHAQDLVEQMRDRFALAKFRPHRSLSPPAPRGPECLWCQPEKVRVFASVTVPRSWSSVGETRCIFFVRRVQARSDDLQLQVCTDITRPFPMSLEFISIAEPLGTKATIGGRFGTDGKIVDPRSYMCAMNMCPWIYCSGISHLCCPSSGRTA